MSCRKQQKSRSDKKKRRDSASSRRTALRLKRSKYVCFVFSFRFILSFASKSQEPLIAQRERLEIEHEEKNRLLEAERLEAPKQSFAHCLGFYR